MGVRCEDLPFVVAFCKLCSDGAAAGFHERNGGNASYRLSENDAAMLAPYVDERARTAEWHPLEMQVEGLGGEYFLVTAAGSYLRNVAASTAANSGIVRIAPDGTAWQAVWGFAGGSHPTSELYAHLLVHDVRKRASGGKSRVVYHAHPSALIALTALEQPEPRNLTRLLWSAHTESIVAFPGGLGALPWMVAGSLELAGATAEQLARFEACIWQLHGVLACGESCDAAFGLVEAIEKAADIVLRVRAAQEPGVPQSLISESQLRALAQAYSLPVNEEFLQS